MYFNYIKIIFLVLPTILFSEISVSGNINFYSAFRSSNSSLIRLPYRLTNINIVQEENDLQLNVAVALEHNIKKGSERVDNSDTQDFSIDLREIYITYYNSFGEFKIGKQIQTWGMVDENSPFDNINAYDYYYLFLGGSDRKIGSFSSSIELYYNDWKMVAFFSPIHNTNRIPVNDSNFPIELSVLPSSDQIMLSSENKIEFGGYVQNSFSNSDFRLMYFNGYDRLFNFSGLNIFVPDNPDNPFDGNASDLSFPNVDIVYGYRKTNAFGFGATLLFGDLTIRSDFGFFSTEDKNNSVNRENPNIDEIENQFHTLLGITDYVNEEYDESGTLVSADTVFATYPISEKAKYYQYTIQIDYILPYETTMIAQLAGYELEEYDYINHEFPDYIDVPNFDGKKLPELNPKKMFKPGMGTTISTLSPKVLSLNLEKSFYQNRLKISLMSLLDINNSRFKLSNDVSNLREFRCEYSISDGFKILGAINKITGDNYHEDEDDYTFNQMINFSHYRLELKYFF